MNDKLIKGFNVISSRELLDETILSNSITKLKPTVIPMFDISKGQWVSFKVKKGEDWYDAFIRGRKKGLI